MFEEITDALFDIGLEVRAIDEGKQCQNWQVKKQGHENK
jgi:hypothetical protein